MHTLKRGILIAVEGIDGSGKTTLALTLSNTLSQSFPVIHTKEPGATALGKKLRTLLQEQTIPLSPKAEFLLFAADRAHHFATVVIPALEKKQIIISDRLADSSIAYQGYGRGLSHDTLSLVNNWAMENNTPDLVIYVKIPTQVAYKRLVNRGKLSSFEQEEQSFMQKISEGFDTMFKDRRNVIHLDGTLDQATLAQQAVEESLSFINSHRLLV